MVPSLVANKWITNPGGVPRWKPLSGFKLIITWQNKMYRIKTASSKQPDLIFSLVKRIENVNILCSEIPSQYKYKIQMFL